MTGDLTGADILKRPKCARQRNFINSLSVERYDDVILSELSKTEMRHAAEMQSYPKWWTLCYLRLLNLPTLDACFIPASCSIASARQDLLSFAKHIGANKVLVRSDGKQELKNYPRGGITYEIDEAAEAIERFTRIDRAVILLEPTNRFSNKLSVNIIVGDDFEWTAEALGCGFDTSDLQRDFVTPEWSWSGSWSKTGGHNFRITNNSLESYFSETTHQERITQRLESIANLYDFGSREQGVERAKAFLLETKNTCLFSQERKKPSYSDIERVANDAYMVALTLDAKKFPFTLAYARLADDRRVYWDMSFGKTKWGSYNLLDEANGVAIGRSR